MFVSESLFKHDLVEPSHTEKRDSLILVHRGSLVSPVSEELRDVADTESLLSHGGSAQSVS